MRAPIDAPRRYQVFISSPRNDLISERRDAIAAILELGWFPTAMEYFPAAASPPWHIITHLIDSSDFVVLLLAGKYGTEGADGRSFTEREYDYATSQNIPVLPFLHADPGALPESARESDPTKTEKLRQFTHKVDKAHVKRTWNTPVELGKAIRTSLAQAPHEHPRPGGWTWLADTSLAVQAPQVGLTSVFDTRAAATTSILRDIRESSERCHLHAAVYHAELIKPGPQPEFVDAVCQAARNAAEQSRTYELLLCSLYPGGDLRAGRDNHAILRMWSKHEDTDVAVLRGRLVEGSRAFQTLTDSVRTRLGPHPPIRIERRFFRDYLVPHALLVIDSSLVYVSLYDWSTKAGGYAPTLRLQGGTWGRKLSTESELLRSAYSFPDVDVVVCDFDGVLVDSMLTQEDTWLRAIGRHREHVPPAVEEAILMNVWAGAAGERVFEGTPLTDEQRRALRRSKDAAFQSASRSLEVFAEVGAALEMLKASHRLAIATTARRSYVEQILKRHELFDCFEMIVTDEDVKNPKPHPEMLRTIAQGLKCRIDRLCLVGDTDADHAMARNAGCPFIFYTGSRRPERQLNLTGCNRVRNWRDVLDLLTGASP
jgi:HAD superfamily hydrolase (TIGR01549 family)